MARRDCKVTPIHSVTVRDRRKWGVSADKAMLLEEVEILDRYSRDLLPCPEGDVVAAGLHVEGHVVRRCSPGSGNSGLRIKRVCMH